MSEFGNEDELPNSDEDLEPEGIEIPESMVGPTSEPIVEALLATSDWSESGEAIRSEQGMAWRPSLVGADDPDLVLHVHIAEELRPHMRARLAMAQQMGCSVVVALRLDALYESDTVRFLGAIDAEVIVVEPGGSPSERAHILTALADCAVAVDYRTRTAIAKKAWDLRSEGTNFEKGRRFEGLLAFLLQQVADFRVVERNLRGSTDEVDLVLQVDNWSSRCWQLHVPFVLIEAKNWSASVTAKEVRDLHSKVQDRTGVARVGVLFSASSFTSDARDQTLKYAQSQQVVALIDGEGLVRWIDSSEPDDVLENLVRAEMLR